MRFNTKLQLAPPTRTKKWRDRIRSEMPVGAISFKPGMGGGADAARTMSHQGVSSFHRWMYTRSSSSILDK